MGKNWKAPNLVVWTYTAQRYHCNISMILWSPTLLPNGDHIMKRCQILKHLSCVCLNILTRILVTHLTITTTPIHTRISHIDMHTSTHTSTFHTKYITAPLQSILYSSTGFSYIVGNCQTSGNNDVPINVRASHNNWRHQVKSLYKWFHSPILLSTLGNGYSKHW